MYSSIRNVGANMLCGFLLSAVLLPMAAHAGQSSSVAGELRVSPQIKAAIDFTYASTFTAHIDQLNQLISQYPALAGFVGNDLRRACADSLRGMNHFWSKLDLSTDSSRASSDPTARQCYDQSWAALQAMTQQAQVERWNAERQQAQAAARRDAAVAAAAEQREAAKQAKLNSIPKPRCDDEQLQQRIIADLGSLTRANPGLADAVLGMQPSGLMDIDDITSCRTLWLGENVTVLLPKPGIYPFLAQIQLPGRQIMNVHDRQRQGDDR